MRIHITAKNTDLSEAVKDRINKKLSKMSRYFSDNIEAQVKVAHEKNRFIVEVTIPLKGGELMRAEHSEFDNLYLAIDTVCEKLERQVHRHKTRLAKRLRDGAFEPSVPEYSAAPYDDVAETEMELIRHKYYTIKPMTSEDAIVQMELLSHSFFAFINAESDEVCVVYKRNDGAYGLLTPEK